MYKHTQDKSGVKYFIIVTSQVHTTVNKNTHITYIRPSLLGLFVSVNTKHTNVKYDVIHRTHNLEDYISISTPISIYLCKTFVLIDKHTFMNLAVALGQIVNVHLN